MKRTAGSVGMGLGLLMLLSMAQDLSAGMVIEQAMKDREGKTSRVVLYVSAEKMRTDDEGSGLTTIADFKGDRMIMVDHVSRQYVEVKFSQWEKDVSAGLKGAVPPVSSRQRTIAVKKTGETAVINGFKTEKVQIEVDGEVIEENWVTRDIDMREFEKVMDRAAQSFSKEFRSEMKEGREIQEKLRPHGFPIRIRDSAATYGLGGIDVLEVKKIEQKELKAEVFAPPAGYKRIIPEPQKK
jgi:hypothetical protein